MKHKHPPHLAEKILGLISSSRKTGVLGDTEEEYRLLLSRKGRLSAALWYIGQIFRPLPFYLRSNLNWSFEMFKNYLISFVRILKRQRLYALINIAGLAVGLACCILITLWIRFEVNYDRFHENKDDLYQVTSHVILPTGETQSFISSPGALAAALKMERPEVLHATRLVDGTKVMLGTKDNRFLEVIRFVDPDFFDMFSLEFIEGDPKTALLQPESIVLTENTAAKYFTNKSALGREILFGPDQSFTVTGVIKEFPSNSFLDSLCLVSCEVLTRMGWTIDRWGGGNFETYVRLNKNADPTLFKSQIKDFYGTHAENWEPAKLSVRPITKIHLHDLGGGGPIVYVYIFTGLSVFILLLAMVNFMNLATARSVQRVKEIGVRKMIGADRRQLHRQILLESVFVSFFSGAIAVGLAYVLLPALNHLTGVRITFAFSGMMLLILAGIVVLTGLLSGLYPAFILSSVPAAQAVKSGTGPKGKSSPLRRFLITFQFALSIFMILAMFGVNKQLTYLNTKDLGYRQDNIVSLGLANEISRNFQTVQTELMRSPEILGVARSSSTMDTPGTTTGGGALTWEGQTADQDLPRVHLMRVDPEWVETFDIDMADGRFFSRDYPADLTESAVINESALRSMDMKSPLGKRITIWNTHFKIIGVIKDFHLYSLHEEIQPLFFVNRYAGFKNIFIRINSPDLPRTLGFIKDKLREIAPGYVPHLKFMDEDLQHAYAAEQRMGKLTKYFSLLAMFISCIGLLGLVSFSARQRTKEIAIRKVLGASEGNIALQLFKEILICMAAANIVVWPVAYVVLNGWLQNYAYHTRLGIGIFLSASLLALGMAVLSVGWNVLKASLANPVHSLRYE